VGRDEEVEGACLRCKRSDLSERVYLPLCFARVGVCVYGVAGGCVGIACAALGYLWVRCRGLLSFLSVRSSFPRSHPSPVLMLRASCPQTVQACPSSQLMRCSLELF